MGLIADTVNEKLKGVARMDEKTFALQMDEFRKQLRDNDADEYSKEAREWALDNKLIVGNGELANGEPNAMWGDFLTREQFVSVLYRFAKLIGKA
jgi:hypothetical protein